MEADPYRLSYVPESSIQTPIVNGSLIQLTTLRNTLRGYFTITNTITGNIHIKFSTLTNYYPLYNKDNVNVTELIPGTYCLVFYDGYVVLVNDVGLTSNEITYYDILGETLNKLNSKINELNLDDELVVSVNGILPDEYGNVDIPVIGVDTVPTQGSDNAVSSDSVYAINETLSNRLTNAENALVYTLDNLDDLATTTNVGHVKVDGVTIVADEFGTISSVQNEVVEVVDNLVTFDENKALSAKQGYLLKSNLNITDSVVNGHVDKLGTELEVGHLKVDNETILVDEHGTISAVLPTLPEQLEVVDNLITFDETKVLSAKQGYLLKSDLEYVESVLNDHELYKANSDTLGHVKVDGITILSNEGVISAVQQVIPEPIEIVDNLTSLDTDKALSARQGKLIASNLDYLDNLLYRHEEVIATELDLGHVKVDNETITISNDGTISAVQQDIPETVGKVNINGNYSDIKIFTTIATVTGNDGIWSIDYSGMDFSEILNITPTVLAGNFSQANTPLSSNIGTYDLNGCNGKAYKVTSAGALLAMQQTFAENGTKVMVIVTGK